MPTPTGAPDPIVAARLAALTVPPAVQFLGGTREALTDLIGAPGLVRKEKGVEVLQFTKGDCVLLAYVYETPEGRLIRHLDALGKGDTGAAYDTDQCLRAQAEAHVLGAPAT